jgi:hypothetical protein
LVLICASFLGWLGANQTRAAEYFLSSVVIKQGEWNYRAIVDADTNPRRVVAVVALLDPAARIGDNIPGVLYTRNDQGGAGLAWNATTWLGDLSSFIRAVKVQYQLSDSQDAEWGLVPAGDIGTPGPPAETIDSVEMDRGLLAEDPLVDALMDNPERQSIITWLKPLGYRTGLTPLEAGEKVYRNASLESISAGIESYEATKSEQASFDAFNAKQRDIPDPTRPILDDFPDTTCYIVWSYPAVGVDGAHTCGTWNTSTGSCEGLGGSLNLWVFTISWEATCTCYARTCTGTQRSTVMWLNVCRRPRSTGWFYVYRNARWIERCCIRGVGGNPPPLPCVPAPAYDGVTPVPGPWRAPAPGEPAGPAIPPELKPRG